MSGQGREFGWGAAWGAACGTGWVTAAGASLLLLTFVCLAAPGELAAQSFVSSNVDEEVTFTRDVASILQENCVQCHRDGGWAPMSLETYEVASTYAPLMKYKTGLRDRAGAMPPWYVEKDIGSSNSRTTCRSLMKRSRRSRRGRTPERHWETRPTCHLCGCSTTRMSGRSGRTWW